MVIIIILTDREIKDAVLLGQPLTSDSSVDLSSKETMLETVMKLDLANTLITVDPIWFNRKLEEYPESGIKTLNDLVRLLPSTSNSLINLANYHKDTDSWYTNNNVGDGELLKLRANLGNIPATEIKGAFVVAISYTSIKPYIEFNHILAKAYGFKLLVNFNYDGSIEENDLICESVLIGNDLVKCMEQVEVSDIRETAELYFIEDTNFKKAEVRSATDSIIDMLKQSGIFG